MEAGGRHSVTGSRFSKKPRDGQGIVDLVGHWAQKLFVNTLSAVIENFLFSTMSWGGTLSRRAGVQINRQIVLDSTNQL
jgi:hypothetical protein